MGGVPELPTCGTEQSLYNINTRKPQSMHTAKPRARERVALPNTQHMVTLWEMGLTVAGGCAALKAKGSLLALLPDPPSTRAVLVEGRTVSGEGTAVSCTRVAVSGDVGAA